jgi:hypothetical protein
VEILEFLYRDVVSIGSTATTFKTVIVLILKQVSEIIWSAPGAYLYSEPSAR